ncbi:MAG: hypothetical protein IPK58_13740 [Acidobacteria bacterium]|nr:hypothetical protein [Acidobacteriota bacterium]
MDQRLRLPGLRKNVRIDDPVKVLLVEIVDGERPRDREIDAIGAGDVVVERDADEDVEILAMCGDRTEYLAIIPRNVPSARERCR